MHTNYLRIEWAKALMSGDLGDQAAKKPAEDLAAGACLELGEGLLVGKGLWGSGLFDRFGCFLEGKKLGGSVLPASSSDAPRWTLTLYPDGKSIRLVMTYAEAGAEQMMTAGEIALKQSAWTQDLLRDRSYARTVAAALLDTMPALMRLTQAGPSYKAPIAKASLPKAQRPKNMTVFSWGKAPQANLWTAEVKGSGKLSGKRTLNWAFTLDPEPDQAQPLYAQRPEGPGQHSAALLKSLDAQEELLLKDPTSSGYDKIRSGALRAARFLLIDNVASGYFGARYGLEANSGQNVLPPATMIGLVLELRGGFAAGLRIYYDEVPKKTAALGDDQIYLSWSRFVVGYAFNIPVPWLIDRIVIAPKIGVWTVNSRLPLVENDTVVFRNFNTGKAFSLGIDLAAEIENSQALARLWHSRDIASPLSRVAGTRYEVLSTRTGIDAVIKGPALNFIGKDWFLSFLLFGFYEDMTFTASSPDQATFTLVNSTEFVGGGLSLSW